MFKPWCERGISLIDDVKYDLRYFLFFVKCCKLLLERSFLFNKTFVYIQKNIKQMPKHWRTNCGHSQHNRLP